MTNNIPVSPADFSRSFHDENKEILELSLEFAHKANEGYYGSRLATDGMIIAVTDRSIEEFSDQVFSVRKHKALTEVSHFIALLQKDKVITASASNTDLLPIAHPRSTQMHMLDIQSFLAAKARWIADDPSIKDEEVRAMVASMLMAPEESPEHQYYFARLENLPQGQVPVRALVAAFKLGANKGFWRLQRRDRKGRFAWMGGGISALIRGADGVVRRLSGRTVSAGVGPGAANDYFDFEVSPGKLARTPSKASDATKAYLPSPDSKNGFSPVKARVKSGDTVVDIADVQFPEAPTGFKKDTNWSPSKEEVDYYGKDADFGEVFTDGNYRIRKFQNGSSPIAQDNANLAREAEKSCFSLAASGLTADAGGSCPISTDGSGKDGSFDPNQPVLFTSRENDPQNPDVFSVTQNWADAMRDLRQDEKRYLKNQPPAPNKKTAVDDANSEQDWDKAVQAPAVEKEKPAPEVAPGGRPSPAREKDRFGVELQPGNGVAFTIRTDYGSKRDIIGEYAGPSEKKGFSKVRVRNNYGAEDGIYEVPTENLEELSKYAAPEVAQGLGLQPGKDVNGKEVVAIPREQLPTLDSFSRGDLESYDESKRPVYDGWTPVDPSEIEKNLDAFIERKRESVLEDERDITHRWRAGNDPTYERYGEDDTGDAFTRVIRPEFEPEGTPEERTEKVLEKMKQDLIKRFIEPNYFYTSEDGENQLVVDKRRAESDSKRAKEAADSFLLLSSSEPVEGGTTLWYSDKSQWSQGPDGFSAAAGLAYHASPNEAVFKSRFIEISGRKAVFNTPDRSLLDARERVFVPAAQNKKESIVSTVAHEYGHIKDFSAGDEGLEITSELLELFRSDPSKMELLGTYGRSLPVEATAEYFAQYYMEKYFDADEAGIPEEVREILEKNRVQNKNRIEQSLYSALDSFDLPENDLFNADGSSKEGRRAPREKVSPPPPVEERQDTKEDTDVPETLGFPLRIPLPGPWNPRIPGTGRPSRPGRGRAGYGPRPPWGKTGPRSGHAPYPVPGRRVFPGEIADMRLGSEIRQTRYRGGLLGRLFGLKETVELRKTGADEWTDLKTGETYTNQQVSEMAATKGTDRSPFTGLATGPEVRPGRYVDQMSDSLFKEIPIGTELRVGARIIPKPFADFRKIGYNQWRRWDGKIFTDDEVKKYNAFTEFARIGEFGPGTPPEGREGEAQAPKPALPRGPLTPEELAALAVGVVVSKEDDEGNKVFFEKTGENSWRQIDTDTNLPDPLFAITNEDLLADGRDITLEAEPETVRQAEVGISPSELAPEALENLPEGTVVGVPEDVIERYMPPRREGQSEEDYQAAAEEAREYFRRARWRKTGPNEWVNDFGEIATDEEIADMEKNPGRILSLGEGYSVPQGYYDLDKDTPYTPEGALEGQTSPDFTDDPAELAQRFSEEELQVALQEALKSPNGYGSLNFEDGREPLPAEALYRALVNKVGINQADDFVRRIYSEGREFDAETELLREFPDINSPDANKRKEAIIQAWNSQWGRGRFSLDEDGNIDFIGDDNDTVAARYLLDKIKGEEWGPEFLNEFKKEYSDVLKDRSYEELKKLFKKYPGLLSDVPEEQQDAILRALDDLISPSEIETDENGNILGVNPRTIFTKYLWDLAQKYIGETDSPTGRPIENPDELPPAMQGLTEEELAPYRKDGDYRRYLSENPEVFQNAWNRYYQLLPEAYNPAEGPEEINPFNLARRFTSDELREQLRYAILEGEGFGTVAFESPSGEPVEFRVPAEALRDALQLRGEDTNELIQKIYDDNPSPARQLQNLLNEISDLEEKYNASSNARERRNLRGQIDRRYANLGGYAKAINDYKKREAALDRLSRRGTLTDEQREAVTAKLAEVRSRRESFEEILAGDLGRGQDVTPFEEDTFSDLERFDFERARPAETPQQEEAPSASEPQEAPAPEEAEEVLNPSEGFASPSKNSVIESLQRRLRRLQSFLQERVAPRLREDNPDSEDRQKAIEENDRADRLRRKINNRISRHRQEPDLGVDPRDSRIVNIRPIDYRPGDVIFDDHFTITRVEIGDRIEEKSSPYYGEREIIYSGYYPGGSEQEKRLPENFRTQALYRGVTPPDPGDLPELHAPESRDYLPEALRDRAGDYLEQVERDPLDGRTRRALYAPKEREFPDAHRKYIEDYEKYEADLARQRASWVPEGGEAQIRDPEESGSLLQVSSVKAEDLRPGDITFRTNADDGSREFFVVQSVENRQVQTGTTTRREEGVEGFPEAEAYKAEAIAKYPEIDEDNERNRKRAYAALVGEYYREAQAAGQARKVGNEYEPLEGPLGDRFGWLLSQKERILAGEKLSAEPGEAREIEEPTYTTKTIVVGYHPGHQVQEKSWNPNTSISIIRGENNLPPVGDKEAIPGTSDLDRSADDYQERLAQRNAAVKESSNLYPVSPGIFEETSAQQAPKKPNAWQMITRVAPAFYGKKILDLVRGKTGSEIKEELKNKRVVFFDFETVGNGFDRFNPDAPIQVAAVARENGEEVDRLVLFINPNGRLGGFYYNGYDKSELKDLPNGIKVGQIIDNELVTYTKKAGKWVNDSDENDVLNNRELPARSNVLILEEDGQPTLREDRLRDSDGNPITDEFLASQPGVEEQLRRLVEFMGEDPYLVAFNADFDINLLDTWAKKLGIDFESDGFIDPFPMARSLSGERGNTLSQVATRYGIFRDPDEWHNAEIDVEVLPELLDKILDDLTPGSSILKVDARAAEYDNGKKEFADAVRAQRESREEAQDAPGAPAARPAAPSDEEIGDLLVGTEAPFTSMFGDVIDQSWIADNENTVEVRRGMVRISELRIGDFFAGKDGGYNELREITRDPLNRERLAILYANLETGNVYRSFSQPGTDLEIGAPESPVRRRVELVGLSNAEIANLLNRNRRRKLGLQAPSVEPQEPENQEAASAIDRFIDQAMSGSASDAIPVRETTEFHFDKNGNALAEGDIVYDPKTGRTGTIIKLFDSYGTHSARNYVRFQADGTSRAQAQPAPSKRFEMINPPSIIQDLNNFEKDIASAKEDGRVIDPINIARKIDRLSRYLNPGPGYIPAVGNALKSAIRAYRRNDFDAAERAASAAEDYADSLEAPRRSVEDIKAETKDRLTGLAGIVGLPDTGEEVRKFYSRALESYNRGRYALARRQLDRTEDLLWDEAEREAASEGKVSPAQVQRFIEGVADLESSIDAPLSREYFARVLNLARRKDYDFDNKEQIIAEALDAISNGFVIPGYQVLERLARARERQLDAKDPKRAKLGEESYAARLVADINQKESGKVEDSMEELAESESPLEDSKKVVNKLDDRGRRGLFYILASQVRPKDVISTSDGIGFVYKIRKNKNGKLRIYAREPLRGITRSFEVDPDEEILLQVRRSVKKNPLPQEARKLGLALPSTEGYNEFEGFTKDPVIDEDESVTPRKLGMAVPEPPRAEKVSATTEQASIIDAVLNKVKRVKVLAFAGSGKTTTLRMAAEAILKNDPKAKILMVMFNKSLKDETSAKMPKGVEVRTSGSLAFQALDNKLKSKLSDQSSTAKYPNMAKTSNQIAKELGIQGARKITVDGEEKEVGANSQVRYIRKAVTAYSYSADAVLGPEHFDSSIENVPDELVDLARQFFMKATAADGNILIKHEHIVKLWALSSPDLTKFGSGVYNTEAGYLFFDEAQDINPVVEKVMTDQQSFDSMIWVGDSRQAIYQFMGAVDALKRFVSDITLTLTESFRFGPQIAGIANRFLALNGEERRVKGSGPDGEIVNGMGSDPSISDPDVIISRTNPGGLFLLKKFLENGKSVAIDEATLLEYESLLSGISWLRRRNTDPSAKAPDGIHPELSAYEDYTELLSEKKEGLLGGGPSAMLNVLQEFKESENDIADLRDLLSRLTVVRDIPSAKQSEQYKKLSYDDIEPGKFGKFNEESEESLRGNADAYYWIGPDGSVNARVFRKSRRQGSYDELKAVHTYLKSLGFKWDADVEIDPRIGQSDRRLFIPREGAGGYVMPAGSALNADENDRFELVNQIRRYANNYFQTPTTPVSFTTAHKAKGREWDRVLIAEDFKGPELDEETLEWQLPSEEELNLMYVAVTRAKKALDLGSLNWIYDETTDDDEIYRQPTAAEQKIGMALPNSKVSRVRFVQKVEEADSALSEQTERVLEELKKAMASGDAPWVEPWKTNKLPVSATTGTPYSGTNLIYLQAVAKNNGWKDNRWITPGEIQRQGGTVKPGQSPTQMTAWLPNYNTVVDENGNEISTIYSVSPVSHSVYNVEQVSGLNLGPSDSGRAMDLSDAEQVIKSLYPDMPRIINRRRTREEVAAGDPEAYYYSGDNLITLPPRSDFPSPEKYFEALAHELIHSTGEYSRLGRDTVTLTRAMSPQQRNEANIEEEMIAQIGTAILASRLGVQLDIPNVSAYMRSWEEVFGSDPDRLTRAARKAQEAVDYILRGPDAPVRSKVQRSRGVTMSVRFSDPAPADKFAMAIPEESSDATSFKGELSETRTKTQEITEKVTAMVIEAIKKGEQLPWNKPWTSNNIFSMPYSVTTNKHYRGFNIFVLWSAAALNGWEDNRWITFNEAKKRGGFVKKGSKGTPIINWSPVKKKVEQEDGSLREEVIFMKPTVHTVFNVEQTEGVQGLPEPELMEPVPVLEAESIVLEKYTDAPPITNQLQDKAYWQPATDQIFMPLREQFGDVGDYLATLFHELTHSTGHESRLNRKDLGDRYATHLDARGEEELIAEMGSAILAARLGVELDLSKTAGYAQSWLQALQNNPDMIAKAAQQAQAAVDYILGDAPYRGESGRSGEERAADILSQRLNIDTPEPYIGDYGVAAAKLIKSEIEGEDS